MAVYNALIRTHHITSRKKIAHLRKAFSATQNPGLRLVLLRVGASPGMMYAEGVGDGDAADAGVAGWVAAVQALRYKDFQMAARVGDAEERGLAVSCDDDGGRPTTGRKPRAAGVGDELLMGFKEVATVVEFAGAMRARGLERWWKLAMGYEKDGDG